MPERRDPPATWLCLRYSKLGPARFTSARDIARLMERAIKRASLPVAYSSGFSPHQRVSYAYPAPTGAASHAEYLLIGLTAPGDWVPALGAQLPAGIQPEAGVLTNDRHYLTQLAASRWRFDWPLATPPAGLKATAARFMSSDHVLIERKSKSGTASQDVRGAVVAIEATDTSLEAVLTQGLPLIRPSDLLAGLGLEGALYTRQTQGHLAQDGTVTNLI